MTRSKVPYVRMKSRKRRSRRRRAAQKAWDTRIRKQGTRQLINISLGFVNPVNKARTAKNVSLGLIKVARPRLYRKSKMLKTLDKF